MRAAIAIQALARASNIAMRAGLHTGECERLDDGLAGVAVHIAARVCAVGGADEVMATGTVRDLVVGSMLAFEPRGDHELRGVPGSWRVFSAADRDGGCGSQYSPDAEAPGGPIMRPAGDTTNHVHRKPWPAISAGRVSALMV